MKFCLLYTIYKDIGDVNMVESNLDRYGLDITKQASMVILIFSPLKIFKTQNVYKMHLTDDASIFNSLES